MKLTHHCHRQQNSPVFSFFELVTTHSFWFVHSVYVMFGRSFQLIVAIFPQENCL